MPPAVHLSETSPCWSPDVYLSWPTRGPFHKRDFLVLLTHRSQIVLVPRLTNNCHPQIADTFLSPTVLSHAHAWVVSIGVSFDYLNISKSNTRGNYPMLQLACCKFDETGSRMAWMSSELSLDFKLIG